MSLRDPTQKYLHMQIKEHTESMLPLWLKRINRYLMGIPKEPHSEHGRHKRQRRLLEHAVMANNIFVTHAALAAKSIVFGVQSFVHARLRTIIGALDIDH